MIYPLCNLFYTVVNILCCKNFVDLDDKKVETFNELCLMFKQQHLNQILEKQSHDGIVMDDCMNCWTFSTEKAEIYAFAILILPSC